MLTVIQPVKTRLKPDMVVHACNPSVWKTEAGVSLQICDQPGLREFKASLNCIVRSCLNKQTNKQTNQAQQVSAGKKGFTISSWTPNCVCYIGRKIARALSPFGTLRLKPVAESGWINWLSGPQPSPVRGSSAGQDASLWVLLHWGARNLPLSAEASKMWVGREK